MEKRQTSFWAWNNEEWYETFNSSDALGYQYRTNRIPIITIAYFLIENFEYLPLRISDHEKLAERIFGRSLLQKSLEILHKEYISLGYGTQLSKYQISNALCYVLLANRSPFIEDIRVEILDKCRKNTANEVVSMSIVQISRVLNNLNIISNTFPP